MTDENTTRYQLSNVIMDAQTISSIVCDYKIIMRDWDNSNISIEQKKMELVQYYKDQLCYRGYSQDAIDVIMNAGTFGRFANLNVQDFIIKNGGSFDEKTRLNISVSLIKEDFNFIINQDGRVPNLNEIVQEHVSVFSKMGISLEHWGGSLFAE